jgi:hypothetical protein
MFKGVSERTFRLRELGGMAMVGGIVRKLDEGEGHGWGYSEEA